MSKIPDLSTIPASVIKDQLSRILLAIPEGAGQALFEMGSTGGVAAKLSPLVEAALGAQKELFEFEKEIRRERCDISAENGLKTI
jgi:hypothetical protein